MQIQNNNQKFLLGLSGQFPPFHSSHPLDSPIEMCPLVHVPFLTNLSVERSSPAGKPLSNYIENARKFQKYILFIFSENAQEFSNY